jgi:hypothetical protein
MELENEEEDELYYSEEEDNDFKKTKKLSEDGDFEELY